jgi:hypothetical protein
MMKIMLATALAASLIAAPTPFTVSNATAQAVKAGTTAKATKSKKPLTAGQKAARARQKQCGAEWKTAKAAGEIKKGMKWPQYWSACNKRLKAGG